MKAEAEKEKTEQELVDDYLSASVTLAAAREAILPVTDEYNRLHRLASEALNRRNKAAHELARLLFRQAGRPSGL